MPSNARILIVEDETSAALTLGETVIALGHHLAGYATTVADALARATERHPDLVLMSLGFGRNAGPWVAAQIRERYGLPVVFACRPEQDVADAAQAAPDAALLGPVVLAPHAPDRIGRAIALALDAGASTVPPPPPPPGSSPSAGA